MSAVVTVQRQNTPRSHPATSDPTTSSDTAAGFRVGDIWVNTTTKVVFECVDATSGAAVWVAVSGSAHPGYVSGRYYGHSLGTASGTILSTENRLYFVPLFLSRLVACDRIAASVSTGAGDAQYQVRQGIYSNLNGRPNSLIVDAGVVSQGTGTGECAATISQNLSGWVWLCIIGNRNGGASGTQATFRGYASETRSHLQDLIGGTGNDNFVTGSITSLYHDQTVASWASYTLPSTAPTLTLAAAVMPFMTLRAA